jgi:hypothetical protein
MDMTGAMPVRAWLIIHDRATGKHLLTTEIDGGALRTTVPELREGAEVDLFHRLEWPDGSVTEDEPKPSTLPAGSWIQIVQIG